ncbi:MAG: isoprenylcysteine carboxylmethyltransferase family protein [Acidobacteriaceae bacterium]
MPRGIRRILSWVDVAFCVAFGAIVAWSFRARWNPRCWIGAAIALSGLALWISARCQLGSSFSLAAKAKALVTTGLYAKLRHPVYYFGFVAWLGIFLIWGRWIPILCFAVLYAAFELPRMLNEDRVLAHSFGDVYREYRARTWF